MYKQKYKKYKNKYIQLKNELNLSRVASIEKLHIDFVEDPLDLDDKIIYKYSQLTNRVYYENIITKKNIIPDLHLGQLKLFYCELIFLTKYSNQATKVIYIGAAEGYHIALLSDLFPHLKFDLWDPRTFDILSRDNIKIYNKFFTYEDAKEYSKSDEKILFICDIRNLNISRAKKKSDKNKMDQIIENDLMVQADWIKIINPIYAFLKFRLPWYKQFTEYLTGTIYLQPYGPFSSETRLMTNDYKNFINYDNYEFDEKLAHFNMMKRSNKMDHSRWNDVFIKHNLLNCWDNAVALYIVDYYLRNIHSIKSDNRTGKLFMDILNFHIQKYGSKYNIIFND
ncbi:Poly(A) polymerase small subunit [Acanthamoeba polyphaga mimivirus]|nr:Poly(A) polymerase small subunit [Acanthamoeba polyphaga mimivirus]